MPETPRRVVFGLGNPTRGDDSAGRLVARLLRDAMPEDTVLIEQDGDAASLLPMLRVNDTVWLIDACCSGAPVGTVRRLDCLTENVPPAVASSSHGLGVAEAIALARALDVLPRSCVLYAIEGAEFTPGSPASAAVMAATREVAKRIAAELVADSAAAAERVIPQVRAPAKGPPAHG